MIKFGENEREQYTDEDIINMLYGLIIGLEIFKSTDDYNKRPFFKQSIDKAIQSLEDAKRDLIVKKQER